MSIKQLIIKLFKINVQPINTINLIDNDNLDSSCRASGRTTRLADMYIQLLFATGKVHVYDHYKSERSDLMLVDIIRRRLEIEHHVRCEVWLNCIRLETASKYNKKQVI